MKKPFFLLVFLVLLSDFAWGQTDTEFWFVAPRVTEGHGFDPNIPSNLGGRRFFFRFASMELPATVTVSMPANPLFTPVVINMAANAAHTLDISPLHNIFWHPMPSQIHNRGFQITSTTPITAYFEIGTHFNTDIFSLKGRNALGTEFYIPFQNNWRNGSYNPQPFSTINIVAKEDNTVVRIMPTRPAFSGNEATPFPPGSIIEIILNRGQTYAVAPNRIFTGAFPRPGQLPANRLVGTKVTSDKPIAITISDDSVDANPVAGCRDLIGDQLIPVNIIGTEYIVMRGQLNANMNESVYILATENNTDILVDGVYVTTIQEGQQHRVILGLPIIRHIRTTHPAYAFHVSGFGCEMGGAVLPPVDACTGSSQVAFTRSKAGTGERFFLNIMVRRGAEGSFILNGSTTLIPASAFLPVVGNADWLAARFDFTAAILVGQPSLIQNTRDLFHLGLINGGAGSGTMYGYFSDFNVVEASTFIVESGTDFEAICYGQSVQLFASGGITYEWNPPHFLSDPFSRTPIAFPDTTMMYTVTVRGACGMVDSASVTIRVTEPMNARFSLSETSGCSPLTVNITNESLGADYYNWNLGDGTLINSGFATRQHTFVNNTSNPVTYNMLLTIRNNLFCIDTMSARITVYPNIVASAGPDLSGCAPFQVTFQNLSSGADFFSWQFGDGSTSNERNPTYTFNNFSSSDTTHTVILRVRSRFGCVDVDTIRVMVRPAITAEFAFDYPQHCSPYLINITNLSFGATQFRWDFGDGAPEQTFSEPTFVYPLVNNSPIPRVFNIRLIASNAYGCSDTLIRSVIVYPTLEARFVPSLVEGCGPLQVSFDNQSVGADFYHWDFGNNSGTSSVRSPVVTFTNSDPAQPSVFDVSLITTSIYGCRDTAHSTITVFPRLEAGFTTAGNSFCAPHEIVISNLSVGATNHVWHFGDGAQSLSGAAEIRHLYSNNSPNPSVFRIRQIVENNFGCIKEFSHDVTIFPEVTANFEMPAAGCHPLYVNFENLSNNASIYNWNFGNGGTSSRISPVQTFVNESPLIPVTYQVQLIATSQYNCHDTIIKPVTVLPKPVAQFELPLDQGCAPFEVTFIDRSLGSGSNRWTMGDGAVYQVVPGNVVHNFANNTPNLITIHPELLVTNQFGCSDTTTLPLDVFPMVDAHFNVSELNGCHPLEVQLTNLSTGATATNPFRWEYGDGRSSLVTDTTHQHTFTNYSHIAPTSYNIWLWAENIYGCRDSLMTSIQVFPVPKALFDAPLDPACSPHQAFFTDRSLGATTYLWNFGNGLTSTSPGNQSSVFIQPPVDEIGIFNVSLQVQNAFGCQDTFSLNVKAYPLVAAQFGGNLSGCHPHRVDFRNYTSGGYTYSWELESGITTNSTAPSHVFQNTSNTLIREQQVRLVAHNRFGCRSETTDTVTVFPRPLSYFVPDVLQGCSPLMVNLDNESVGATSFNWVFNETKATPLSRDLSWEFRNTTSTPTNVQITLVASNQWGCSNSFEQQVRVFPEVKADFTVADGGLTGCSPLNLQFVNQSINSDRFVWNFNDNTTSIAANPRQTFHAFNQTTNHYDVELTATSVFGCIDTITRRVTVYPKPVADFMATPAIQIYPDSRVLFTNQSLPGSWRYTWNLDDGTVRIFENDPGSFTHDFRRPEGDLNTRIYNVNLHLSNGWCFDNLTRQIVIRAPYPVAQFQAPLTGCPPFAVNFANQSLYSQAFWWDFGDGNTSNQRNPSHVFQHPGIYDVSLITLGPGGSDTVIHTITVHQPPIADFKVMPPEVTLPNESVRLVNLSSNAYSWEWDLGDGTITTEFEPVHYYKRVGVYDIKLTVTNNTYPVCYDTKILVGAVGAGENCKMYFPNAFTPVNEGPGDGRFIPGDPLNQVFHPVHFGIDQYVLEIYNRWGELIFRSEDPDVGWNGFYRDKPAPMGVYVWKVRYTCFGTDRRETKSGDVTLIR
ncbi:MAG TPA: PKD domain-containing protein [Bacteroidales bacterium]|nr:PKD domain-containing protein [Bacteroidales bacterium]